MEFLKDLTGNFIAVIKKYTVFTGRAGRKEFWYFLLAGFLIGIVFGILSIIPIVKIIVGIVSVCFSLAIFVPSLAVSARRLHDTDKSGWLMLLGLIPFVGVIILIIFWALQGTQGENKYGLVPAENKALKDWNEVKELKDVFKKEQQENNVAGTPVKKEPISTPAQTKGKQVFCGSCGAKNESGTKFCGSCGAKLD